MNDLASTVIAARSSGSSLYTTFNGKSVIVNYYGASQGNNVTIALSLSEFNCLAELCDAVGLSATYPLAIMAHESQFNANAYNTSGASGLMQVLSQYYQYYLTEETSLYAIAKKYAGTAADNNPFNPYGNMTAGLNMLRTWKNIYGEADMLKAYCQGNVGSGWTESAIGNAQDFLDIKAQLDAL